MIVRTTRGDFYLSEMTEAEAAEVCTWRYAPPLDVYNTEDTEESRKSFLDGLHYTVRRETSGALLAFIALGPAASLPLPELSSIYKNECYTDLALGVHPAFLGQGLGGSVFDAAIKLSAEFFPGDGWRVTVAEDNPAALRIYCRRGFEEICSFCTEIIYPDGLDRLCTASKKMLVMVKEADA